MDDFSKPLTAKAKLKISRAELLAAMGYEELRNDVSSVPHVVKLAKPQRNSAFGSFSEKLNRSLVGRWWRRHPLNSAVELAEPFLQDYAAKHPGKLVAYSAGAGAAFWLVKPWRLLSLATVIALVVKTSNVSGMVSDLIPRSDTEEEVHP